MGRVNKYLTNNEINPFFVEEIPIMNQDNQLEYINTSGLSSLYFFKASNNQLIDIDLSANPNLGSLADLSNKFVNRICD